MQQVEQVDSRPFVFTATGTAYFRIWIVNLLLSIITIGFYSPWAKVRRLRYFYGNTLFDGSPFEFHGRPIALLKGRLIGAVLLIAYSQAAKVSLTFWLVIVAALIALLPWLLWKSLRFRFANSSYRGIRFGFDGTVAQAYLTFVPLIVIFLAPTFVTLLTQEALTNPGEMLRYVGRIYLALGVGALFVPWFYFRLRAYQHRNGRLGQTPFGFDAGVGGAYWLAIKIFLLAIGFMFIAAALAFAAGMVGGATRSVGPVPGLATLWIPFAVGYLIFLTFLSQPMAMIQNFVWNHSTLGGAPFTSNVSRSRLWLILLVNIVLTFITIGFYWPFAVVRTMRYRIGSVAWSGDSNGLIVAAGDADIGATGEETAEWFGLDIAL
jgi:uncharacterized membrane protein YjgN (DUF898 family)